MTDLASLATAEDGQNILLLGPPLHGPTTDTHQALLTGENPSELRVLCVTYRDSPGNVISTWQTDTDVMPAQWGIIVMGDQPGVQGHRQVHRPPLRLGRGLRR